MSREPHPAAPAPALRPALLTCLLLVAAVLAVYGQRENLRAALEARP